MEKDNQKTKKQLLAELAEARAQVAALEGLRVLIKSLPDHVYVKDREGRFLLVNTAQARYMGVVKPDELVGKSDFDFYPAELASRYHADEQAIIRSGQPLIDHEEINLNHQTGEQAWTSTTKIPVRDDQGQVVGIAGISRDITPRKRAETTLAQTYTEVERRVEERTAELQREIAERERIAEALAWEEYLLHALLDNLPDHIYFKDTNSRFIRIGKSQAKVFGLSDPVEAVGKTDFDFFTEEHARPAFEDEQRIIETGQAIVGLEEKETWPDGSESWVATTKMPLRDKEGHIIGTFGISTNINERKQAEAALARQAQELARSNVELEQFAYVASHDLQEPLRMVRSYVQLLERRYKNKLDADADEFIAYAVDGAARMQTLINDLLAYSRIGTQGKTPHPTNCAEVLERVLANLSIAIEESEAVVMYDALPTVLADEVQLSQLFQNLIGNAIKFRGEATPKIQVGAERKDGEWLFWVRDNGIGIAPEYYHRLFMIFQRLHSRDEYPGTGIGLAICKKIVERHGGRIWVESVGVPGKGTTFYFSLPDREGDK